MIIKCKMCGGDIQFQQGDTVGQCEYCGSSSTIPVVDEEQRLNRYNRANHFRRLCDFDKAITAYERILEENDSDAEAHWGIVLSRYGIEYVEDPVTKNRIPTCHRVQVESILADADYLATLKYAPDTLSRNLYEKQAKEIAEIQKGILAISHNEKPYDVFICYKESDENGQRTRDSSLAQEIYYGLTEQGYKVFFSRITLEDKLGQQYEPYIFAALNSARVMIVVGTKPEYYNAVWVRNEWSRYLHLMKNDRKRLLIPCYRDMDPYDLPEELSNLQSQDMSRIGFMQDLLRGIRKVLDSEKEKVELKQTAALETGTQASERFATPGVNSLLKRAHLFMEDGDFKNASDYLDRVLDIDPECSAAYAAKVCTQMGVRRETDLANLPFQFEDNSDWQKAVRFANAAQKRAYTDYVNQVKERTQEQVRNYAFDCAVEMAVKPWANREKLDSELEAYRRSSGCSSGKRPDGNRRAGAALNERVFMQAVKAQKPGDVPDYQLKVAAKMFDKIGDPDALKAAEDCRQLAERAVQKAKDQIRNYAFDCALEMATKPGVNREELDSELEVYKLHCTRSSGKRPDGSRRAGASQNEIAFKQAVKEQDPGDVPENQLKNAVQMLEKIGDLDAMKAAEQCRQLAEQARQKAVYHQAVVMRENDKKDPSGLENAARIFLSIPEYKDARTQAERCTDLARNLREGLYTEAMEAMNSAGNESRKWETAKTKLSDSRLDGFRNSAELRAQAGQNYQKALAAEAEEKNRLETIARKKAEAEAKRKKKIRILCALAALLVIAAFFVVTRVIPEMVYRKAKELRAEGNYSEAIKAYKNLGDYNDAIIQLSATYYADGIAKQQSGDWYGALAAFTNAGSYNDAETQVLATYYAMGITKQQAGDWSGALAAFTNAGSYSDAETQISATYYAEGVARQQAGDWSGALMAFSNAGNYSDTEMQISATFYAEGIARQQDGDWSGALTAFSNAGNYSDTEAQITETEYQLAKALIESQNYSGAARLFINLKGYKDVDILLENDNNLAAAAVAAREAMLKPYKTVGSYVSFGTYPQTSSGGDQTMIEWLVLDYDETNNRSLLLSRYGLDAKPYNPTWDSITWEKCSLRSWLNGEFLNKAFSPDEQSAILLTSVDNSSSQGYSGWYTSGGNSTQDQIFLLSYAEANRYLNVTYNDNNNTKARVAPTDYAIKAGAYSKTADGNAIGWWWLRSPGSASNIVAIVSRGGSVNRSFVYSESGCVRPAFWLNLESNSF